MYKLCFYVPETHLEIVKKTLFAKGAGRIGQYDSCAWQVLGEGQFRPLHESKPFIGTCGKVTKVKEFKVEMVCSDRLIHEVIKTLRQVHPYEQPAYDVWKLADL